MNQTTIVAVALAVLLPMGVAQAQTYKYTDQNGNTVYSQTPPESGDYKTLSEPAPASSEGTSDDSQNAGDDIQRSAEKQAQQDKLKELTAKNDAIRQRNCESAKKNLQIFQVYRRIRDKNGNVVRLTDEERQKKIDASKRAIEQFCN